ncbi:MAG: M28 family peptidase [Deltaproteobacteria bacterium]|nr:M28 family peptidase [Deltaproteobacteria bacterium]
MSYPFFLRTISRKAPVLLSFVLLSFVLLSFVLLSFVTSFLATGCFRATPPEPRPVKMPEKHGISPVFLKKTVEQLAVHPRSHKNPEHYRASALLIENHWRGLGLDVIHQKVPRSAKGTGNLIVRLGKKEGPRVVVGAHYDSAYDTPGADDNASGVAVLLALSSLLAREKLPFTLELVAWANEEPPYFRTNAMGSYVHAQSLKKEGINVVNMISIESVGYYSDKPDSQTYPSSLLGLRYPTVGNFLAVVGKAGDEDAVEDLALSLSVDERLPVYSGTAARSIPGIDFSDHLNFWNAGFVGVMVTDTALMRNKNYHERTDTPDTLDYFRMMFVVKGLYRAIVETKAK